MCGLFGLFGLWGSLLLPWMVSLRFGFRSNLYFTHWLRFTYFEPVELFCFIFIAVLAMKTLSNLKDLTILSWNVGGLTMQKLKDNKFNQILNKDIFYGNPHKTKIQK